MNSGTGGKERDMINLSRLWTGTRRPCPLKDAGSAGFAPLAKVDSLEGGL